MVLGFAIFYKTAMKNKNIYFIEIKYPTNV